MVTLHVVVAHFSAPQGVKQISLSTLFNDTAICCDYIVLVLDEQMGMVCWCGDTDRGELKFCKKILSQCHFVQHKSHMNWPGIKPGLLWWESGDYCLSYGTGQMDFLPHIRPLFT